MLYLALLRAVTMSRIFEPARYLMLMILRTYKDMIAFLFILFFLILGKGAIFMVINQTNKEAPGDHSLKEFKHSLDMIYNWGFGNWEGTGSMNTETYSFYLNTGIFVGLVMFNILISIICGTCEEFTEKKEMIDLKEILAMLSEMTTFFIYAEKVPIICVKPNEEEIFYHFLVPDEDGGVEKELKEVKEKNKEKEEELRLAYEKIKKLEQEQELTKEELEESKKKLKMSEESNRELKASLEKHSEILQKGFKSLEKKLDLRLGQRNPKVRSDSL